MALTPDKLARIDLNLLVTLSVLLEERNVTRAAERLFITQPAMSRTLSRLRSLFDDPLFTRAARGLVPTPRAEQIEQLLPQVLVDVSNLVAPEQFDPSTSTELFRVAMPEQFGQSMFGVLLACLAKEAPGISIEAEQYDNALDQRLASGSLDFGMDRQKGSNPDIDYTQLTMAAPTLIARHGHPLAANPSVSLKEALEYPFVLGFASDNIAQHLLFEKVLQGAQVCFQTNHMLSALQVVRSTDSLMPGPPSLLKSKLLSKQFVNLGKPKELKAVNVPVFLQQHQRSLKNPAHMWLKQKLVALSKECWH